MSKFFESDEVQAEIRSIFENYHTLATATDRLKYLTKPKRLEHIDKTKALIEKQKIFFTRLSLAASEDEEAADLKTRITAMAQTFGYRDLLDCFDKMFETLLKAEEKIQ